MLTACRECQEGMWPLDPRIGFTDLRTRQYYAPLCQGCANEHQGELEDRVANLEALSGQQGSPPRRYYDQLQQLRGELAHLKNKLMPQSSPPRLPTQTVRKRGVRID